MNKTLGSSRIAPSQRGFTLVELMISVLLGLLILAGVISIFLGSKRSFRTTESLAQVQESGRFLQFMVFPYIRLAGYLPDPLTQIDPPTHFRGGWQQINGSNDGFFTAAEVTGISSVDPNSDAVLVTYAGNDIPTQTCRGATVGADQIVATVFFVTTPDSSGVKSLSCATAIYTAPGTGAALNSLNGAVNFAAGGPNPLRSGPQPLIYGVQDMQIVYGEDRDATNDAPINGTPGLVPTIFVTADNVIDWTRVVAVKFDVTTVGSSISEGANVGGGTADTADDFVQDGRLQRLFSGTIHIRNRMRS